MTEGICTQPDCETTGRVVRGLCTKHYRRWRRHGDPTVTLPRSVARPAADVLAAALSHVDDNGCWISKNVSSRTGYGYVGFQGRPTSPHRLSYEHHKGPIPDGYHVDHLCRVRACFNPEHLEAVTPRENLMRSPFTQASVNAARTHCPAGHAYTVENTYLNSHGRICRTCNGLRQAVPA